MRLKNTLHDFVIVPKRKKNKQKKNQMETKKGYQALCWENYHYTARPGLYTEKHLHINPMDNC